MGILGGGGHAELVVADHRVCIPVPGCLDWVQAAAIPEAFLTAFDALLLQGGLRAGEACLIQAAASGVGTAALQIASLAGAAAVGLCRTSVKRERLRDEGHERILDPAGDDVAGEIRRATAAGGINLVLDLVGPSAWSLYAKVLRERGRIVLIGLLGGPRAEVNASFLLGRRATVTGSVLRSRSIDEKAALTRAFTDRLLPRFEEGRLSARVDRTFGLAQVADAHAVMERNENIGKIVLTIEPRRS